jgi:hypothetical protein
MITIKPHNQLSPALRPKMAMEAIDNCESVAIDLSAIEPTDEFLNAFIIDLIDNDAKRYNKYVTLTGIEQARIDDLLLARRKYHIKKSRALSPKFKANYHNVRDKLGRFVKGNPRDNCPQGLDDAFLDGFAACERLIADKKPRSPFEQLTAWKKHR